MARLAEWNTAPPMDPHRALAEAVRRAAGLLSQGKTEEATILLKAAAALEKLRWAGGYDKTGGLEGPSASTIVATATRRLPS